MELAKQLNELRFGIICLSFDNLEKPWVLFEAGAISNHFENRLSPYLLGLTHADIKQPLAQFQLTVANEADTKALLLSINRALGGRLDETVLGDSFDVW